MNPVSKDIMDLLVAESLGQDAGTADWAIYRSEEPDTPDKVITIYDTGGPKPWYYMDATIAAPMYPSFQVRVRGQDYTEVYTKIEAIRDYLNSVTGWFVGVGDSTEYGRPFQTSEILSLGKDESGRSRLTVNFRVIRQDVT